MLSKRLELKLSANKTSYCNSYCLSLTSLKVVVLPIPANVHLVPASSIPGLYSLRVNMENVKKMCAPKRFASKENL